MTTAISLLQHCLSPFGTPLGHFLSLLHTPMEVIPCVLKSHRSLHVKVSQMSGFLFILQTRTCSRGLVLKETGGTPWTLSDVTLKKLSQPVCRLTERAERSDDEFCFDKRLIDAATSLRRECAKVL